jgi:hypothetical protein
MKGLSTAPGETGRDSAGCEQTFPLQENDSGLTRADPFFVKPL